MKKLRQLCAALVLTLALSTAALGDGTIHTGAPPPPPPPPVQTNSAPAEPAGEAAGEEPSLFEAATAAALDFLRDALTLF